MKIAVQKDSEEFKKLVGPAKSSTSAPTFDSFLQYPQTQPQDDSWVAVEISTYEAITENKDHLWFKRHVPIDFDPTDLTTYEAARANYKLRFECYMMGYLSFYDDVSRSCAVDHTIFFKWTESSHSDKKSKKLSVEVYLNPAPKTGYYYLYSRDGKRMKIVEDKSGGTPAMTLTVDPPPPNSPPPPGSRPTTSSGV